jgi:hypothetical protein
VETVRLGWLATSLGDLAQRLQDESNLQGTLDAIVYAAVETIPGADHAGISEIQGHHVQTAAATGPLVRELDQAQYDGGEGPCLSSLSDRATVHMPDLFREARWPAFTRHATGRGIGSVLSVQLCVARENLGALNLYAGSVAAFTEVSERVGLVFAAHAGVAMSDSRTRHQLTRALVVRDVIGQAKGILMERHRITAEQAFTLLVTTSQRGNVKLVEVARHLTESGELAAPR